MATAMEKLRAARIKQDEQAEAAKAAAQAALTPPQPGAPIPPGTAAPTQPMDTLKVTIVGVLKQRNADGTEQGVSQTITLQVPQGFPKADYEKLMPQVWNVIIRQVGGLQNTTENGSFTFYKDDLFERYGATFHEVVGVTI